MLIWNFVCRGNSSIHLTSSTQKHVDSLHDIILLWVIWMFLTWNFQDSRNRGVIVLQHVSDTVGNMLVDENNSNILSGGVLLEGLFHLLELGVSFDDQKV